jgi:4'-phosphopantetheinyl transferase
MGIRVFETEVQTDGAKVLLCYVDMGSLPAPRDAVLEWLLTPDEKAEVERFKFPKRRSDWLGGRLAVKLVVARAFGAELPSVDVVPNWTRKPFARIFGQFIPADVSISHSSNIAVAALLRDARVGVDIERVEPRSQGFYDEAFSESERKDVIQFGAWDALTKAWTMKEALSKTLGIGLGLTLHDIEVKDLSQGSLSLSARASERLIIDPSEIYRTRPPDIPDWASGYVVSVCAVADGSMKRTVVNDFISSEAGQPALRTGGTIYGIR